MPYAPGESGNPKGRPKKGESLTDALKLLLSKRANRDEVARKVYDLAMQGNMPAMQLLWERTEGKTPDRGEHTVDIGETLAGALRDALRR